VRTHCVVSHRWLSPLAPDDAEGSQLQAVQSHVRAHPEIEWVWFDFWSMPQGERTAAERIDFKHMLVNINVLYLGMRVLILLDLSYISRFWTQFEAWCSMQSLSAAGLAPARSDKRRCTIIPILGANSSLVESLTLMWGSRDPHEAHTLLSKEDVIVTNQSDKEAQLPKILELSGRVRAVLSGRLVGSASSNGLSASLLAMGDSARRRSVSIAGSMSRSVSRFATPPARALIGPPLTQDDSTPSAVAAGPGAAAASLRQAASEAVARLDAARARSY